VITREQLRAVLGQHDRARGIRDGRVHCACGWKSGPGLTYKAHLTDALYAAINDDEGATE